jgi:hypothetical protein
MSEPSQNSAAEQLEPIPAIKTRKSRKAPIVQQAVIAKSLIGTTKSQIARDLNISRGTVDGILSNAEIEQHVLNGRSDCVRMIPRSVRVIDQRLQKGSETAALAILRGTQVLTNQQPAAITNNIQANTWITMRQQRDAEDKQESKD